MSAANSCAVAFVSDRHRRAPSFGTSMLNHAVAKRGMPRHAHKAIHAKVGTVSCNTSSIFATGLIVSSC